MIYFFRYALSNLPNAPDFIFTLLHLFQIVNLKVWAISA